ncbi:butyrophilin subfamily 1 member A1-like isoform X2 [Candoia aspera]|uniref:butyrophilin subfamily 1 member A1-like isoform X2 n=1 Tax=Candoia aspera TaxID=51853 RepID=UPI002FD82D0A
MFGLCPDPSQFCVLAPNCYLQYSLQRLFQKPSPAFSQQTLFSSAPVFILTFSPPDVINSGCLLCKAYVTLDPDTAHPKLVLSEDRKSMVLGNKPRITFHCCKTFDQCLFVLGHKKFKSGRYYWEVTVGNEDGWGLGVARASVRRKGIVPIDPAEGIWAMAKWGDHCTVLLPPHFPILPISWDLKRIRVSLNYTGGRLSFFDADRGILLFAFSGASFSGESLHPFFWLWGKAQLSLCH